MAENKHNVKISTTLIMAHRVGNARNCHSNSNLRKIYMCEKMLKNVKKKKKKKKRILILPVMVSL